MDRSQLLARVLLALGASASQSACQPGPATQPTTIRVDQPAEPEPDAKKKVSDGRLPKRTHGYTPEWQPTEAGAGCTQARKVPSGFSNPRYDGCPQRLMRASSSAYEALRTPRPPQLGSEEDLRFDETLTARARAEGDLEACCYRRDYPMIYEGRPLRWQGGLLLPELQFLELQSVELQSREPQGHGLCQRGIATRNPEGMVDWRESARHEHASSASFVRLALDLVALGAPRLLVSQAQSAAREELQHAALALRLAASRGDACCLGALPVPHQLVAEAPETRISRLARELLLDAALGEGLAALEASQRAGTLPEQFRVEMLQLAEEETRHALFGWRVLRWLVSERPGLLPRLHAWLEEAACQASESTLAMIGEVMRPALASMEAGVAAQGEGVRHLSG